MMSQVPGHFPKEPKTRMPLMEYLQYMRSPSATSFTLQRDIYPFLERLGIRQDHSAFPALINYAHVLINREADAQQEADSSSTSQTRESN